MTMCLWHLGWKLGQAEKCSFWMPHFYQWSQFVKTGFRYSNHDLMAWCGIQCCLINNTALIIRKGLYCNHIQISNMDLRWFGSSVLSINFWAVWCSKNCISKMFKLDPLSMQSFYQKTPSYVHEKNLTIPYFTMWKDSLISQCITKLAYGLLLLSSFGHPVDIVDANAVDSVLCRSSYFRTCD